MDEYFVHYTMKLVIKLFFKFGAGTEVDVSSSGETMERTVDKVASGERMRINFTAVSQKAADVTSATVDGNLFLSLDCMIWNNVWFCMFNVHRFVFCLNMIYKYFCPILL